MKKSRSPLPWSNEAEQGVIGGVLLRPEVLGHVPDLEVDDFYDLRNRAVWTAMRTLEAARRPIDAVTVEEELERCGRLEAVGGAAYLGEVAMRVPTPENVVDYAAIIRRKASTRQLVVGLTDVIEQVRGGLEGDDVMTAVDEVLGEQKRRSPLEGETMGAVVRRVYRDVVARADRIAAGENLWSGIPTGFAPIDDFTGGVPVGVPTWVCGRPSGGKTLTMQNMAENMAAWLPEDEFVLYLSNEDVAESFAYRLLGARSGVPTSRIIRADITDAQSARQLATGANYAVKSRVIFCSIKRRTGEEVARLIRRYRYSQRGRKLRAVFVDYVQKLEWPRRITDPVVAIGRNVAALSDAVGDSGDNCALIGGVQLLRSIESRPWNQGGPVPQLADLKGSGDLEQDGKFILGIHHPWSYATQKPDGTRIDQRTNEAVERDVLEFHLLKHHNGEARAVFRVRWDYQCHRLVAQVSAQVGLAGLHFDRIPHPAEAG